MEKPKGPGDCEACAKVMRHAVKYLDGTDCGLHPGIEGLIRQALLTEREASVRLLRHWALLSGAFEDVDGRDLLNQFAKRLEDAEHLIPPGTMTKPRDPSRDTPSRAR